jgi:hypothetical protein
MRRRPFTRQPLPKTLAQEQSDFTSEGAPAPGVAIPSTDQPVQPTVPPVPDPALDFDPRPKSQYDS